MGREHLRTCGPITDPISGLARQSHNIDCVASFTIPEWHTQKSPLRKHQLRKRPAEE